MDSALITAENDFWFYFYSKIAFVICGDVFLYIWYDWDHLVDAWENLRDKSVSFDE